MFIQTKDKKLFEFLWVKRYCKLHGIVYSEVLHAKLIVSNKVAIEAEFKAVNPKKKK
jgi:hypothetical protein